MGRALLGRSCSSTSPTTFNPQRITSYNRTIGTPLPLEEQLEPTTYPPVRRMTIRCEQQSD